METFDIAAQDYNTLLEKIEKTPDIYKQLITNDKLMEERNQLNQPRKIL